MKPTKAKRHPITVRVETAVLDRIREISRKSMLPPGAVAALAVSSGLNGVGVALESINGKRGE